MGGSESDPLGTSLNETTDLFFLLALKEGLGKENGGFDHIDLVCVLRVARLLFLERLLSWMAGGQWGEEGPSI